jgi:hypothetical protein
MPFGLLYRRTPNPTTNRFIIDTCILKGVITSTAEPWGLYIDSCNPNIDIRAPFLLE